MERLQNRTLDVAAANGAAVPRYERGELIPGVVHLGLGAFHRAHQAMVFDDLLSRGDTRWAVLGVAMRSTHVADSLAAQDGLYAVQIASRDGTRWQVPGAIVETCVAAREAPRVVQAIAAPSTRWITLTVTEKGYGPGLASLIVQGLVARRAAGLPGLTIASCDNLSGNGRKLQALCEQAAPDAETALWIGERCAFPNSMVDRIVPAATDERLRAARESLGLQDDSALGTEAFWEWVIERRFVDAADGDLLADAGVNVVDDVRPFEEAKLRMLNGSHTAMACMGAVAGLAVICDCISQPAMHTFVHGLMTHEVAPHVTRPDWQAYRDALLARFANPALKHSVHQIATDSTQKIPQRWPPSILGQIGKGQPFERLAFAAAAWMRYCTGESENGHSYALLDPMAERVQALALAHAGDAVRTVHALGSLVEVWGEAIARNDAWQARVAHWLARIHASGVLAAVEQFNRETSE
jgi:fructuronate reductase